MAVKYTAPVMFRLDNDKLEKTSSANGITDVYKRQETPYACLADLFDGEKYRLQNFWKGKQDHHQKMTSLEKAIVEADEKVGLILMLQNGTLIRPLPEDGSVEPVSDTKIQAELLYNRIHFSK